MKFYMSSISFWYLLVCSMSFSVMNCFFFIHFFLQEYQAVLNLHFAGNCLVLGVLLEMVAMSKVWWVISLKARYSNYLLHPLSYFKKIKLYASYSTFDIIVAALILWLYLVMALSNLLMIKKFCTWLVVFCLF